MAKRLITTNLVLALLLVFGTACSKKSTKAKQLVAPPDTISDDRNDGDDSIDNHTGGFTTTFVPVSLNVFEDYAGRAIDEIQNVKINLDYEDVDPSDVAIYGGEVRIGYDEVVRDPYTGDVTGTVSRVGKFQSSTSHTEENQIFDSQYNKFYTGSGGTMFKSFVQDALGALIVIFDEETNDMGTWSGKVYYKNFNFSICGSYPPYFCNQQPIRDGSTLGSLTPVIDGSLLPCWFIKTGPYECRDFLSDGKIRPDLMNYPITYKLLGRFENVDLRQALNIED